jgi:hypothetical protein
MASSGGDSSAKPDDNVAELLKNLNLTEEEDAVLALSDEDPDDENSTVEWALLGKVLSPSTVHVQAILGATRPAWGNPAGLKIRLIGKKGDNLFVVEFDFKLDMERALNGSPWLVGKHAVVLHEYDTNMKPSEIHFDRLDVWARIIDLPLGWMNKSRGERVMGLIGDVKRIDVGKDDKASGPYLRARVSIEAAKLVRRGVLLKIKKDAVPEWFDIQYE